MKVNELIERLKEFDPETMVIVNGYEDGYDEIVNVKEKMIDLNVHSEWYYGSHDDGEEKKAIHITG